MRVRFLAIAALAIVLSGCAGPVAPPSPDDSTGPTTLDDGVEVVPAVELVGVWKVSNAEGEGDNTYIRLAEEVMVWNDCGIIEGSWRARNDAFIASFSMWSGGSCADGDDFPVDWVRNATGYSYIDGELSLVDASGKRLATLTKDGKPRTDPNMIDDFREQPVLSEIDDRAFKDAVALPDEATPVRSLVGRWLPADYDGPAGPDVEFFADGTWGGSDGCNGVGGRWVAGTGGALLATAGPSTQVGCEGSSVAYDVAGASTVGMLGDELTLYDAEGTKLGALVRA